MMENFIPLARPLLADKNHGNGCFYVVSFN